MASRDDDGNVVNLETWRESADGRIARALRVGEETREGVARIDARLDILTDRVDRILAVQCLQPTVKDVSAMNARARHAAMLIGASTPITIAIIEAIKAILSK